MVLPQPREVLAGLRGRRVPEADDVVLPSEGHEAEGADESQEEAQAYDDPGVSGDESTMTAGAKFG